MKFRPVVHPFLFGIAPMLLLFGYNARRFAIGADELLLPVLLVLGATLMLLLVLGLVFRSFARAGLVVSLLLLLFFSYGHAAGPEPKLGLTVLWGVLLLAGIVLVAVARRDFRDLTAVLNVVALAVAMVAAVPLLARRPAGERAVAARGVADEALPDIYYIILDTYVRDDVMKSDYGLDISEFLEFLKANGFYVAERSSSNYAQTYLSLASSLNFTYLDSVAAQVGPDSRDQSALIRMIEHSRVAGFLRRQGYSLVTFASGYTGTELKDADRRLAPRWALSEFQDLLLETTMLPALLGARMVTLRDESHRQRVLYTLRAIPGAARQHPAFVFAHVVCPHTPFVFDAQGRRPDIIPYLRINQTGTTRQVSRTALRQWYFENYAPQVTYLNTLLKEMVRRILAESRVPPIIILQGDHGAGQIVNTDGLSAEARGKRVAILNAIKIPPTAPEEGTTDEHRQTQTGKSESEVGVGRCASVVKFGQNRESGDSAFRIPHSALLYDSISPVNTFRVLFSTCFDTSMALLPDRSFFSTLERPFRFEDE